MLNRITSKRIDPEAPGIESAMRPRILGGISRTNCTFCQFAGAKRVINSFAGERFHHPRGIADEEQIGTNHRKG